MAFPRDQSDSQNDWYRADPMTSSSSVWPSNYTQDKIHRPLKRSNHESLCLQPSSVDYDDLLVNSRSIGDFQDPIESWFQSTSFNDSAVDLQDAATDNLLYTFRNEEARLPQRYLDKKRDPVLLQYPPTQSYTSTPSQVRIHGRSVSSPNTSLGILLSVDSDDSTEPAETKPSMENALPRVRPAVRQRKRASTSDEKRSKSQSLQPLTQYTFVQQQPDRAPPAGQVTMIRQTAMKNFLQRNGGDPRTKRKSLNADQKHDRKRSRDYDSMEDSDRSSSKRAASTPEKHSTPAEQKNSSTDCFEPTTVVLSSGRIDKMTVQEPDGGMVCDGTSNTLYSPFFTMSDMTVYLENPYNDKQPMSNMPVSHWQSTGWPELSSDTYGTDQLKYYCSFRFATPELARYWAPVLTKSKNAFYSTLCLSAAHDEIMEREFGVVEGRPQESTRRLQVWAHIIKMITQSMNQNDTSDGAVLAVLHVMYSEMIGGRCEHVMVHRKGLNDMVNIRGGVVALGTEGQLARTLSIVMYLVGCITETSPDVMYTKYVDTINTEPPPSNDSLLDSPIYTAARFCSISQARWQDPTQSILELTRKATQAFFNLHDLKDNQCPKNEASAELKYCNNSLLAFPSVDGDLTKEQGLVEVIRLSCCIFVHGLVLQVPLSEAVKDKVLQTVGGSASGCKTGPTLLRLKEVLKQSPFEDCWDTKSGVLLWCGLVALASSHGNYASSKEQSLRQARDFIAAVTLRTAIVQIFSHPVAMLGMLKRFHAVQQVLSRGGRNMDDPRAERQGDKGDMCQMKIVDRS
ncbi:hypothetical protein AMS68_007864 [Peltaster fructicola]|uniref:Transcription factor domain-containing protein n=1 Tax=Peltaster fructicola TaxID=286661 RepID=A0A6H0Y5L7_9PEZI|nr:hypothetical protein AMS68_007864 [Peltaster fructicola]